MKKLLGVLAAGLLVFGAAGMAKADLTDGSSGDLVRVIYQTTASGGTYEFASDLGSITSVLGGTLASNAVNPFASGTNFTGTSYSNLQVAYFATDTNNTQMWLSGPSTGTQKGLQSAFNGVLGNAANLYLVYANQGNGTATPATGGVWYQSVANTDSYYFTMNGNGSATGTMGEFYPSGTGEMQLVNLASVTQGLFDFTAGGTVSAALHLVTTVNAAGQIITTEAGGSPTPIPPSVLLLGSGLLGLVGIRRRNIFNF